MFDPIEMTPEMARKHILGSLLGERVESAEDGGDTGAIVGFIHPAQGSCNVMVTWDSGVRTPAVLADLTCGAAANLFDAVKTWANCREANVSGDGRIWIADPQRGHWLNDDDIVTFINWTERTPGSALV